MKFLKINEGNGEILGNKSVERCCIIIMFEALEEKPGYA